MLRDDTAAAYVVSADDGGKTDELSTCVRRFTGPEAHELFAVARPPRNAMAVRTQAEAVYGEIAALLAAEGASSAALTRETIFFRDIRNDLPRVLDARRRILGGSERDPQPLTLVEQPPVDGAALEVSIAAVVPRRRRTWSTRDVWGKTRCRCASCARTAGRLVALGDRISLHTGSVHGVGDDAFDEAYDMFHVAEELLSDAGMTFRDVLRTWIYVRDIDRHYADLNRARRAFFRHRGVALRPASTGIGGAPFSREHRFAMSLSATRSPHRLERGPMSAPTLNEAWTYGADFSRGLRVVESNKIALYVSGTASVDERGRTVHGGDVESQAERMLVNVASLLASHGASFRDALSAVTYVRHPRDAAALRATFRARGFDGFPTALVAAPICRPDLLCETEVVAALPLRRARA